MQKLLALFLAFWLCLPSFAQVQQKPVMFSPTRGLVSNIANIARSPETAQVLNNLHQFTQGVWTSRGAGWTKERSGTFNSGASFKEMAQLYNIDNTSTYFFQVAGKLYTYDFSTHTETQVGTGFDTSAVGSFKSVFYNNTDNYILFCNGVQEPYYWNKGIAGGNFLTFGFPRTSTGVTFSKPKFCEVFVSNRLCFAGFDSKPNQILIFDTIGSDIVNSPQEATDAGYVTISPELGAITGLKSVRIDNSTMILLVACERGIAAVTGKDATDFRAIELSREFGVPSNRTWQEVGDTLFFVASDGIRSFTRSDLSQTKFDLVSAGISDLTERIATAYASKSFATKNTIKKEVVFWLPVDADTAPAHAIVMSYNLDPVEGSDLQRPSIVFSTQDGISPTCGAYLNGNTYYGRSDGYLMTGYSGDTYDGSAISWEYMSPLLGDLPIQSSSLRKFTILTDGTDQKFNAKAYTLTQLNSGTTAWKLNDTKDFNVTADTITKIGTWTSGTTTSYPKFLDFESKGLGRYWAIRLTGSTTTEHISLVGVHALFEPGGIRQ